MSDIKIINQDKLSTINLCTHYVEKNKDIVKMFLSEVNGGMMPLFIQLNDLAVNNTEGDFLAVELVSENIKNQVDTLEKKIISCIQDEVKKNKMPKVKVTYSGITVNMGTDDCSSTVMKLQTHINDTTHNSVKVFMGKKFVEINKNLLKSYIGHKIRIIIEIQGAIFNIEKSTIFLMIRLRQIALPFISHNIKMEEYSFIDSDEDVSLKKKNAQNYSSDVILHEQKQQTTKSTKGSPSNSDSEKNKKKSLESLSLSTIPLKKEETSPKLLNNSKIAQQSKLHNKKIDEDDDFENKIDENDDEYDDDEDEDELLPSDESEEY